MIDKEELPTTKNDLGVDCISRIETIDYLCKHCPDDGECFKDCDEIKHLRQMPSVTPQLSSGIEKNSKKLEKDFGELDCISRADVLKLMQDNWHTHNGDWAMQESMDDIRALPSVTPQEPRKGHWIDTNTFDAKYKAIYMCSNCRSYYTEMKPINMNYCPNCGAKMFEPQESEK